jgi:hypothetical protein
MVTDEYALLLPEIQTPHDSWFRLLFWRTPVISKLHHYLV